MQGTSTNANKNTDGVLVLCGFLNLVRIVMEEPTSMFTCFVPNVLDLCFGPLKEMIFFHSESDAVLLSSFVALVEQILDKHYRFFVVTSMDSNGQRERAYASEKAHTYFLNVFESLASVLTQPSLPPPPPFVCRQVFQLLDRIDQTQALFSFYGFQKELWMGYITTFLKLLISNERNLLKEEMGNLLYRLARVNFDQFYQNALPFFLKQVLTSKQLEKATNKEQECLKWTGQTDLPTFLKELDAFLNDLNILLH
jgi:hypothetical protein